MKNQLPDGMPRKILIEVYAQGRCIDKIAVRRYIKIAKKWGYNLSNHIDIAAQIRCTRERCSRSDSTCWQGEFDDFKRYREGDRRLKIPAIWGLRPELEPILVEEKKMIKFLKKMHFKMTEADIDYAFMHGGGCNPHRCPLRICIKRGIFGDAGGHGYVSVDARGVSITRRDDYREHAMLPKWVLEWFLSFDDWAREPDKFKRPAPIDFTLYFKKSSPVGQRDREEVNKARRIRKAAPGYVEKKYNDRERIRGVALAVRA